MKMNGNFQTWNLELFTAILEHKVHFAGEYCHLVSSQVSGGLLAEKNPGLLPLPSFPVIVSIEYLTTSSYQPLDLFLGSMCSSLLIYLCSVVV